MQGWPLCSPSTLGKHVTAKTQPGSPHFSTTAALCCAPVSWALTALPLHQLLCHRPHSSAFALNNQCPGCVVQGVPALSARAQEDGVSWRRRGLCFLLGLGLPPAGKGDQMKGSQATLAVAIFSPDSQRGHGPTTSARRDYESLHQIIFNYSSEII